MLIPGTIRKKAEVGARGQTGLPRLIIVMAAALMLSSTLLRADDIGDLQSKADAWISKSKEIYRLDCDDMKQIWGAYCSEYDVTQERDRDAARSVADKMKDEAQSAIQRQLDEYGRLKSDAERLKTGDTESQAAKILAAMQTEVDRLEKLKDKGAWRGSNHPLIQYAMEYGKQKHEDMGRSSDFNCDVVDKEISGADGRPDCISARRCIEETLPTPTVAARTLLSASTRTKTATKETGQMEGIRKAKSEPNLKERSGLTGRVKIRMNARTRERQS